MELQTIYKKYNFPSKSKLYALAKKEGVKATMKDIETFLNKQNTQQIFSRKVRQKPGHIVSFQPGMRFQMDLVDMTNFSSKNGGYGWIMLLVDVFTRKLYAYRMKSKNETNILAVLNKFFDDHHPDIIMSDNESGFKSKSVQKLMDDNHVINDMVEPQDHKALGVIDRAVQTIKNAIYKYMKEENTTSYSSELPRIIEAYNDTPNSGIMNIAPNDAEQKENKEALQILNNRKEQKNLKHGVELTVGDTVRVRLNKNSFTRSYDEKYSDKQYTIKSIEGRKVTLDDGSEIDVRRLIKTEPVIIPERKQDNLSKAKKESKIKKAIAREKLDVQNKQFENLPKEKTRTASKQHKEIVSKALNTNEMKGLSKKDRYKFYDLNKENILETKRKRQ